MKEFKKVIALLLALMLVFSLAACGGNDKNTTTTDNNTTTNNTTTDNNNTTTDTNTTDTTDVEYDEITLNIAGTAAETNNVSKGMLKWEELVEEKSGGKVQVEVFLNATFGTGTAVIESIQAGSVQLGECTLSSYASFCPDVQYTGVPFSFDSREHAYAWTQTDFAQQLKQEVIDSTGMYILGWFENGIRMLSNGKHTVTCPDDMKGLKIRVMDSPIYIEMFTEMGASPTPMAYSEVYTALQQGTVDGQDNPYSIFVSTNYYEVQDYFTDLSHTFDFTAFVMSNDVLNSVNDATREMLIECGKECEEYQHQVSMEAEADNIQKIKDEGVELYNLTDEERQLFRESVAGIQDWMANNVKTTLTWDAFQASLEEARDLV